ncbi:ABC transporter permease [Thalassotalea atypica]|uniref:ABC transporter permease n=1 Tax=Thalassotalea atypica TaxID=2054316 RepID=UPI0025736D99|nr:FtsX-like permease family protein [Thalassotalea atypica]
MSIFASWGKQSLRLLQHELRRGELTIICLAIILAVATVFSLAGFSTQIKAALLNKSTSFIASDRVLASSRPINMTIIEKSQSLGIKHSPQIEMTSMVFAQDKMQLTEIKAVSELYPLRGELLVKQGNEISQRAQGPQQGSVWVEQKLLSILGISLGDEIEIGIASFLVAGILESVPDESFSVFTNGPTVMMNINDVAQTELIQPGSRVGYKALFAGDAEVIKSFEEWVKPKVNETQSWYDIKSRQSALSSALTRAEKYLSLASMLGIILAAVAVAVASRRYGHRHQPMVAVFKAMGASQKHITKLYCLHWTLLSVFGIAVGLGIGFILQQVGLYAMADYLSVEQSVSNVAPFLMAVATGVICAIAFAIAPLSQLVSTKPLAVIRGFSEQKLRWFHFIPPIGALFILLYLFSNDLVLSLALLGGGALVSVILLLLGRVLVSAGRNIGSQSGKALHLAFANLKRRAKENSVQLVSFTIAIKLLLLILVIRSALIAEWQSQLPENTANRFLVNITAEQVEKVDEFTTEQAIPNSGLYPVVRGRLIAINEDDVTQDVSKEDNKDAETQRRGLGRELNLTWRDKLPNKNEIIEGDWFEAEPDIPQVSIEEGVAKRLEIKVGDTLTFQLGSETFTTPVTSIRQVDWQSLQPNFFMIFNEQVLSHFPATYISSLYVDESKQDAFDQFMSSYPTISMIDVDALIYQLRTVIDQVSVAVEFILVLVVIAGSLVLLAQVQASMEEREREIAILRTLGAKGSLLRGSVLLEFICLGVVSGLMAGIAMEIAVYFIQTRAFSMSPSFHFEYWGLGIVAGGCFVGIVGMLSCWRLLTMSSVTLIRRTM